MRVWFCSVLALLLAGCGMSIPDTPGAFIQAVQGDSFESMETLDPRNAMVYIYRPGSRWGYEEVQAPSFFVDDQMVFGVKSGAYSWLELNGGSYDLYAKRPLGILFLKTIFRMPLQVAGGKSYFLRYSETDPVNMEQLVSNPEDYMQAGPVQQVPRNFARREIEHLKLDEPGVFYGSAYQEPRWAPFYTYPRKPEQ